MMRSRCSMRRVCSREKAKRRISATLKPWKLFFLINSYRFMLLDGNEEKAIKIVINLSIILPIYVHSTQIQWTSYYIHPLFLFQWGDKTL